MDDVPGMVDGIRASLLRGDHKFTSIPIEPSTKWLLWTVGILLWVGLLFTYFGGSSV